MPKVITYKKLKDETETIMNYGDVIRIIENELGPEVVEALIEFEFENEDEETPYDLMISYIETGIFAEQIRESDLIEKLVENIIIDLEDQGYLKKNKNIDKFIPNKYELEELIDIKLSPGMMNYFEQ